MVQVKQIQEMGAYVKLVRCLLQSLRPRNDRGAVDSWNTMALKG